MKFITLHHSPEQKKDLFALIGEYCASAEVRANLGGPISSSAGHTWLIALDGDLVAGFAAIHPLKSKDCAVLAHLYAVDGRDSTRAALMQRAEKLAAKTGMTNLKTVERLELRQTLQKAGWAHTTTKGSFGTFEKRLCDK